MLPDNIILIILHPITPYIILSTKISHNVCYSKVIRDVAGSQGNQHSSPMSRLHHTGYGYTQHKPASLKKITWFDLIRPRQIEFGFHFAEWHSLLSFQGGQNNLLMRIHGYQSFAVSRKCIPLISTPAQGRFLHHYCTAGGQDPIEI